MHEPPSVAAHHAAARRRGPVPCAVVTVSDTRTPETDESGRVLRDRLMEAGHPLVAYRIVPDEADRIGAVLDELLAGEAQAIVFNGGTGISARDTTFDALDARLEKRLPGFGELFRMLSFAEIGAAAMLSRATAGSVAGRLVVALPGSPAAVRLAWDRLLAPELAHLVGELAR